MSVACGNCGLQVDVSGPTEELPPGAQVVHDVCPTSATDVDRDFEVRVRLVEVVGGAEVTLGGFTLRAAAPTTVGALRDVSKSLVSAWDRFAATGPIMDADSVAESG